MSCQLLPLYYEKPIANWFALRFPNVRISQIVSVERNMYHVLVSKSEAGVVMTFLTKDIVPPFKRRTLDPPGTAKPKYEPALCLEYYDLNSSTERLTGTMAAYRALLAKVTASSERSYLQRQLNNLEAKLRK